jgi:hypothetical protein
VHGATPFANPTRFHLRALADIFLFSAPAGANSFFIHALFALAILVFAFSAALAIAFAITRLVFIVIISAVSAITASASFFAHFRSPVLFF